jgi:hypothetical protein
MGSIRYLMHTLISGLELISFAINLIKRNVHEPLKLEFIMKEEIFYDIFFRWSKREKLAIQTIASCFFFLSFSPYSLSFCFPINQYLCHFLSRKLKHPVKTLHTCV